MQASTAKGCANLSWHNSLCRVQRVKCGSAQTQNSALRDGCVTCLHVLTEQIHLYCVDDGDHNVLLKLLGLEKGSISYKLLLKWYKLFCNTSVYRIYFCRAGEGSSLKLRFD